MARLLCCVLSGEFHSKWKDHEDKILCQGCITDLLDAEYGNYNGNDFTNRVVQDFKFLHPISDCDYGCMSEHLFEDSSRIPKIIMDSEVPPLDEDYIKFKLGQCK